MEPTPVRIEWPNGQIRVEGQKLGNRYVGEYRSYTKSGALREQATYLDDGRLQGEATLFHHGEGKVATRTYREGVVVLDDEQRADVVRLVRAKDQSRDIREILGRHAHQRHEIQLLWDLVRRGELPAHEHPPLWRVLREDLRGVRGEDVAALLARLEMDEEAMAEAERRGVLVTWLPFWPYDLDAIVSRVYPRDPEPFRRALPELPPAMADGVRTVMARSGESVDGFGRDMARVLAERHLDKGLGEPFWWPEKDRREAVRFPREEHGWPDVTELVERFTSRDAFLDALVAHALDLGHRRLPLARAFPLLARADAAQLPHLVGRLEGRWSEIHQLLRELRLPPERYVALADHVADAHPAHEDALLLAALDAGADPSLLGRVTLQSWDRFGSRRDLTAVEAFMVPVLERLEVEAVRARLSALLRERSRQVAPCLPIAARYADDALLAQVSEHVRERGRRLREEDATALALSWLGAERIPWMLEEIEAHQKADPPYADRLVWAVLRIAQDEKVPAEVRPLLGWKWPSLRRSDTYLRKTLEELQKTARRNVRRSRKKAGAKKKATAKKKTTTKKRAAKKTTAKKTGGKRRKPALKTFARALVDAHGAPAEVTLLKPKSTKPGARTVNRAGGLPIGVDEDTWPRHRGVLMEHLITLDAGRVPALRRFGDGVKAVALFADSRRGPQRFEVVLLGAEDLRKGVPKGDWTRDVSPRPGKGVDVRTLVVPGAVFGEGVEDEDLRTLRDMVLSQPGFAAPSPLWIQAPQQPGGPFGFQVDERLCDAELGDGGMVYVFGRAAFVQSL